MKKHLKRLAAIATILYMAQAMVGIYFGIQVGIKISQQYELKGK